MKAAVVHEFGRPLVIENVGKPVPGPGQVLVKVETSGLCHTDIHAARGDWPVKPAPPFIPGHEGVGLVERLGEGVTRLHEGDRVAVPWLGWACGACEACASGWETLCPNARYTGYTVNGGFAEYVVAEAAFVGLVPSSIDPLDAAPLTCAGVTTYKAVKVSGARSSDLVAVFGIGGLGHMAVQYARIAGATVAAVDVVDSKLDVAKDLGATYVVNATVDDPAEAIQALGGADAAIVLAATPQVCEQAFASLKRNGTLVLVACQPTTSCIYRSSRPFSRASRWLVRLSAPASILPRRSISTPTGERGSSENHVNSITSTRRWHKSSRAGWMRESCSTFVDRSSSAIRSEARSAPSGARLRRRQRIHAAPFAGDAMNQRCRKFSSLPSSRGGCLESGRTRLRR